MWWIEKSTPKPSRGGVRASAEWTDSEHTVVLARNAHPNSTVAAVNSPSLARVLPPTSRLTAHQCCYIFGLNGILAMVISGGINFAVAYAMYTKPRPDPHPPPLLFSLPSSFVGDAAITAIIQSLLSWAIPLFAVNADLCHGRVAPLGIFPEPRRRRRRRIFFLDDGHGHGGSASKAGFALAQLGRAAALAFVSFCVMIGPTVGVLIAVGTRYGGDWAFPGKWAGPVFKLVYGGVMALLVSPAVAMFWMVRAAWVVKGAGAGAGAGGR